MTENLLTEIDNFVDGTLIRSRSEAIEKFLLEYLAEQKSAVILIGGDPQSLWIPEIETYRPLVSIGTHTLIEDTIFKIRAAGFETVFIVGSGTLITEVYPILRNGEDYGVTIQHIEEFDVLGTAKSLQQVQYKIKSDFLLVPGDTYFNFNLAALQEFHQKQRAISTFSIYTQTTFDSKYKGVVEMEGSLITKHTERPEHPTTHLIKTMIAMMSPEIFEYIPIGKVRYTLENHVIPDLIKERKCYGYLVAGNWFNLHSLHDLKQLHSFLGI